MNECDLIVCCMIADNRRSSDFGQAEYFVNKSTKGFFLLVSPTLHFKIKKKRMCVTNCKPEKR